MLPEALAFPRADDGWLETVLIGGVLSILSFLILPAILVNGYMLRVLRAAVEGDETPPRFGDWADLFVDGLLVWVIQFVYIGVPTVVLGGVLASFLVIAAVVSSAGTAPGTVGGLGIAVAAVVILVAVLFFAAVAYLLPAALANFARTGRFASAFHLRTVARAAYTADYLIAVVLAIAVSIVIGFVGGLLLLVLVGIFVLFYLQVVVYHLFGQGFARGFGLDGTADDAAAPSG